jgi:hypothetical protein
MPSVKSDDHRAADKKRKSAPGTDVMIFFNFRKKIWQLKKIKAAIFAANWRKSLKLVIITLTPGNFRGCDSAASLFTHTEKICAIFVNDRPTKFRVARWYIFKPKSQFG